MGGESEIGRSATNLLLQERRNHQPTHPNQTKTKPETEMCGERGGEGRGGGEGRRGEEGRKLPKFRVQ